MEKKIMKLNKRNNPNLSWVGLISKVWILLFMPIFSMSIMAVPWHPLIDTFPESTLFYSNVEQYKALNVIAGAVQYQQTGNREGYRASDKITIAGESREFVHDYKKDLSSMHLFKETIKRVSEDRFEIVFQCDGVECGDLSGWQLYLSRHLLGDEASQHYFLAKQKGRSNNEWYIQYYVIDLDKEPRSFLRIINAGNRPKLNFSLNSDQILSGEQKDQLVLEPFFDVLFGSGQYLISEEAGRYLERVRDAILSKELDRLYISGHSDSMGSAEMNSDLAMKRAQAVADALKQFDALQGVEMVVKAYGETQPVADNQTEKGRMLNRRVTIN